MATITDVDVRDIRFPTSKHQDGSDAMNKDPDYSAAYGVLRTSSGEEGVGFVFTIGRGNETVVQAIRTAGAYLIGQDVDALLADLGAT